MPDQYHSGFTVLYEAIGVVTQLLSSSIVNPGQARQKKMLFSSEAADVGFSSGFDGLLIPFAGATINRPVGGDRVSEEDSPTVRGASCASAVIDGGVLPASWTVALEALQATTRRQARKCMLVGRTIRLTLFKRRVEKT